MHKNSFNPFDPTGAFQEMRDASLDQWARALVEIVNTDAYAEASGAMLDAWLAKSGPLRKLFEAQMTQTLTHLNLPSRDDITRLAERMTSIELRLDDLDAMLEEILQAVRPADAVPASSRKK